MSEEMRPGEKYEQEIIDRLWGLKKEGKCEIGELCQVQVGNRLIPLVEGITGDTALITAGHHIHEAFGTYETVFKLLEHGTEGVTGIPVVDIEHYDLSRKRVGKWFHEAKDSSYKEIFPNCPDWLAFCIYEMLRGYKDNPPTYAENDWSYYKYSKDGAPEQTQRIQDLIELSKIIFDIHNTRGKYSFIIEPTGQEIERIVQDEMLRELELKGQEIELDNSNNVVGIGYKPLRPGFFTRDEEGIYQTIVTYAGKLGKLSYGVEVPTIIYEKDGWPHLRNIEAMVDTNVAFISKAIKLLR